MVSGMAGRYVYERIQKEAHRDLRQYVQSGYAGKFRIIQPKSFTQVCPSEDD